MQDVQLGEGLSQISPGYFLVVDVERLEDGLVDEPADRVVGSLVEVVEVFAARSTATPAACGASSAATVNAGSSTCVASATD